MPLAIVLELDMESMFVQLAKVISLVISLGLQPLRSALAFCN